MNGAKSPIDWSNPVWATVAFSFVAVAAGVVVATLPIDINMGGLGPHDHDGRQKRNRTGDEVGGKSHNCNVLSTSNYDQELKKSEFSSRS